MTRIFVVDDNPTLLHYLRSVLEQQDDWHVCNEAHNGREAVEMFPQIKPDLVVLDFQMPEMNGLEAARQIIKISPDIPILMVSLYLSTQLAEEARKAGIKGACAKSEIHCVVNAVEALLREETYFPN